MNQGFLMNQQRNLIASEALVMALPILGALTVIFAIAFIWYYVQLQKRKRLLAERMAERAAERAAESNQANNVNRTPSDQEIYPASAVGMVDPPYPQPSLYVPTQQKKEEAKPTTPSTVVPNHGIISKENNENQVKPIIYSPSAPVMMEV